MHKRPILFFFSICICLWSCTKKPSDPSASPQDKETGELTPRDIYDLAIATEDDISTIYQGGEHLSHEASGDLSIYATEDYAEETCGIALVMENKNTKKSISAVIKAKFRIPDNEINEIQRLYRLKPGQVASIGCSHICHRGHSYMIQREIVSAEYADPVSTIDEQPPADSTKHAS